MEFPKSMTYEEAKSPIRVPNPQKGNFTISKDETGYPEDQVFRYTTFDQLIIGKFIGLEKTDDGESHPAYALTPSKDFLWFTPEKAYENGIKVLNEFCKNLISPNARSITLEDLEDEDFNHKVESEFQYWIASRMEKTYENYSLHSLHTMYDGKVDFNVTMYSKDGNFYCRSKVRPVIVLPTTISDDDLI